MHLLKTAALTGAVALLAIQGVQAQDNNGDGDSETKRTIEEIVVHGDPSLKRALDRKRNALDLRDVVDYSEIDSLPDIDINDAASRLPGVSLELGDQREFQNDFIIIRGIQPSQNAVTILGQEITSTQGDRDVALDFLPSRAASLLEVQKTFRSDLSVGAIGGVLNIVPLSAFERSEPFFQLSLRAGYTDEDDADDSDELQPLDFSPNVFIDVGGAKRFGANEQFGIGVAASHSGEATPVVGYDADDWTYNAGRIDFLPDDFVFLEDARLENGMRTIEEWSVNTFLEYHPNDEQTFYLNWLHADSREDTVSLQSEWNFLERFQDVQLLSPGVLFNQRTEYEQELDVDFEEENFDFVVAGMELQGDDKVFDASIGYVKAEAFESVREWQVNQDYRQGAIIDLNQPVVFGRAVVRTATGFDDDPRFLDPAFYSFDEIDLEPQWEGTENIQAAANFSFDTKLFGNFATIKTGIRYRSLTAFRDLDEVAWDPTPGGILDGTSMADLGIAVRAGRLTGGLGIPVGPTINPVTGEALLAANPDAIFAVPRIDFAIEDDFEAEENIYAAYLLTDLELADGQLKVNAGVRYEHTDTIGSLRVFNDELRQNNSLTFEELFNMPNVILSDIQVKNDYDDWLPSVGVIWAAKPDLLVRASYSRSVTRPRIQELAITRQLDFDEDDRLPNGDLMVGGVSQGNTNLKPLRSDNFDVSVEYYTGNGVYSVSAFHKDIKNPIFNIGTTRFDTDFAGERFVELEIEQPENAGDGKLTGIEAAVDFQFSFLDGIWSGLGIKANIALIDSEQTGIPGRETEKLKLFRQPDVIGALSPYFEYEGFIARFVYRYKSGQLIAVEECASSTVDFDSCTPGYDFDKYTEDSERIDVQLSYEFGERYRLSIAGRNLTGDDYRAYQGAENQIERVYVTPRSYFVGLQIVF